MILKPTPRGSGFQKNQVAAIIWGQYKLLTFGQKQVIMDTRTEYCREILNEFLSRWTLDAMKKMSLDQYVSIGNNDTFCQWVETQTVDLGNIKGRVGSIKFGIYKRNDKDKKPKMYANDNEYSWQKSFNAANRKDAFEIVKGEVIKLIENAEQGNLEAINNSPLYDIFKWKVAYLFSNERIIPIFKREILKEIAKYFGLEYKSRFSYAAVQEKMIERKPVNLSIYEYSVQLWNKFSGKKWDAKKAGEKLKKKIRKAALKKNTATQVRRGASSYIATQKHNKLQEALKKKLIENYGELNVTMEENFVNLKVSLPDKIFLYEVKSASWAGECIEEALGQILKYSYRESDGRTKHLFVVGQYPPNEDDKHFIEYLRANLKLNFSYENIDIKNNSK